MQLAALANWPQTTLSFDLDWRDTTDAWHWHDWHIRTAETRHELTNRAIRITRAGRRCFTAVTAAQRQSQSRLWPAPISLSGCASLTALSDDASHGDFPSCLALFQQLNLPALGSITARRDTG
jgi:hypothetical protein